MTKNLPDEITLKTNSLLDEPTDATPCVIDMLEKNSLSICASKFTPSSPMSQTKPKFSRTKTAKAASFKTKLGRAMHKLHNLEGGNASEKHVVIDLGSNLYQMEDY